MTEDQKLEKTKIAVIGGGSWATALVKILSENNVRISWWFRHKEDAEYVKNYLHNPKYLTDVQLNSRRVKPYSNINKALSEVSIVIFAVPGAFLKEVTSRIEPGALEGKIVVSAIKGIIPEENILVTDFFEQKFQVPYAKMGVIAGPCHAEEVALEKQSYLTIASPDINTGIELASLLTCRYVKTSVTEDIYGIEYAAIMKNIIAIACGITHGLNYGDNFQAVLVSNAISEIKLFIETIFPMKRDLNASAYLGDLLVTAYSSFSRNRTLGNMVGRGYSVKSAQIEMNMVAEGYYAVKSIHEINKKHNVPLPICKAVYNILYEKISPAVEIQILRDGMR